MRARAAAWAFLALVLQACEFPPGPKPSPSPSLLPSPSPVALSSAESKRRANAELLREMMLVVRGIAPQDTREFASYVNVLQQGASFEGLYNMFTHSSSYRSLELSKRGASPQALKIFGEELEALESELPNPTEFTAESAQPLPRPVMPEAVPDRPVPSPKPGKVLPADAYSRLFVGASIFTLKRVLGDEALKVVASKRDFPGKLALWYSKSAVRLAERGVDFGLPLRNKADESFHYNWALKAALDQLEWEVLNRLHRILNAANKNT